MAEKNVNIKVICALSGMTITELAEKTGINARKLRRIANGSQFAEVPDLWKICKATGFSADKILEF